jgi:V/A-type H+-transporting ATPase subunit I
LPALEETLRNRLGRPFVFNHRDPAPGEWQKVPSCLQHPRILQPFAGLVKLFGVPRYQEIDPTLIFTFAFLCLFGMMFGDVGHGASLMLLAWLLRARFPPAVPPLLGAAGTASMVFGFLYGSVFGHEQLISPLWVSPADDPLRILQAGIYTGIGFILVTSVMSVVNLLGEGHFREALWDRRGLAGILVYLGGIYAFSRWLATSEFGAREWVSLLGPLGLLLAYRGWMAEGSPAERLLVACIEGLDTAMGYLTNTLSFMRVAAFSLSHAALAVTVFTLADRYPAPGQWLLLVLGNALIVALEGGIVAIQVLRLSYYEGFSRFFRGDGHAFRPLRLRRRAGSVHVAETISGKG